MRSLSACFEKRRLEQELEKPTYAVVESQEGVPTHIILYDGSLGKFFLEHKTVYIQTPQSLFSEKPVPLKQGTQRVTRVLSLLQRAVNRAEAQNY